MLIQTQVTEEELREVFADTLDKGASRAGISVTYQDGLWERAEIGVPYTIKDGVIEIGPYFKNIVASVPKDYNARKKLIPISDIVRYRRIEISDIF